MQCITDPGTHPPTPPIARRHGGIVRICAAMGYLSRGSIHSLLTQAAERNNAFLCRCIGALAQREDVAEGAAAAMGGVYFEGWVGFVSARVVGNYGVKVNAAGLC